MLDLAAGKLLDFIIDDFEAAWDSLASNPVPGTEETSCLLGKLCVCLRSCAECARRTRRERRSRIFSGALKRRDPRYFTVFARIVWVPFFENAKGFRAPAPRNESRQRADRRAIRSHS
jgi:hypothetical protein